MLPLSALHPFNNHPFKVNDDDAMMQTVESVKQFGVLIPTIVRPLDTGGYELVSGYRRHHASELAGMEEMSVIVRNLSDDEAILIMVDSNLQCEILLHSEKAFAYRMRMEAMKRQGARTDLTPVRFEPRSTTREKVAKEVDESAAQI